MATLERTLGLIKPDAVRAGKSREIMQLAELSGFQLLAKKDVQVSYCKQRLITGFHHPLIPVVPEIELSAVEPRKGRRILF